MGKIIISQNVTLDGVVEDPTGEVGFRRGGWFGRMTPVDREEWAALEFEEAKAATALLLGRGSDSYFGARWNAQTSGWAQRLNALPKFVISSTIDKPVWTNGTVLRGDVLTEVATLKERIAGDIVVYASRPLVHTLLEHDLVDEIRLVIFPVIAGEGHRLFADLGDQHLLTRGDVRAIGDGLVAQTYRVNAR
jgi:dihydrofolate reductase